MKPSRLDSSGLPISIQRIRPRSPPPANEEPSPPPQAFIFTIANLEGQNAKFSTSDMPLPVQISHFFHSPSFCHGLIDEIKFDEEAAQLLAGVVRSLKHSSPPWILVFIACGIGGAILKRALHQASQSEVPEHQELLKRTSLITFCGTPHRPCLNDSWESILHASLIESKDRDISQWTPEQIHQLAEIHRSTAIAFEELSGRFRVVSYYQDNPIDKEYDLISPKYSATLGWKQEMQIAVHQRQDSIWDFSISDGQSRLQTLIKNAWIERGEEYQSWLQVMTRASYNTVPLESTYPVFKNFSEWLLSSIPSFYYNLDEGGPDLTGLSDLTDQIPAYEAHHDSANPRSTICRLSIQIPNPNASCSLSIIHSSLVAAIESKVPRFGSMEDLSLSLHSVHRYRNPITKVNLIANLCIQILKGRLDAMNSIQPLFQDVLTAIQSSSRDLQEFWLWKCFATLIRACRTGRTYIFIYEPKDALLAMPFTQLYDDLDVLINERTEINIKCLFIRPLESSDAYSSTGNSESQIFASIQDERAVEALKKDHWKQLNRTNLTQSFKTLLMSGIEAPLPQLISHPLDSVLFFAFLEKKYSHLSYLPSMGFNHNHLMNDATALVLGSISVSERQLVRAGLVWIAHGIRPLTVSEFSAALIASSEADEGQSWHGETLTERFIQVLCGLVQRRENFVYLMNSSLTDHVTTPNGTRNEWYEISSKNANRMLAGVCMRRIQLQGTRRCQNSMETNVPPENDDSLISYAVENWLAHATLSGTDMSQDIMHTFGHLKQSFWPSTTDVHPPRDNERAACDPGLLSHYVQQPLQDCAEIILHGEKLQHLLSSDQNTWHLITLAACQRAKEGIAAQLLQRLDVITSQDTMRAIFRTSGETLLCNLMKAFSQYVAMDIGFILLSAAQLGQRRLLGDLLNTFPFLPITQSQDTKFRLLEVCAKNACLRPSLTDHLWTKLVLSDDYLHKVDESGNTLLHLAAMSGHVSLVEKLIQWAINLNLLNAQGETALFLACEHGHYRITDILLEAGVLSKPTKAGAMPLHAACSNGSNKIVQILLQKSAPLFELNMQKQTPLHVALERRQFGTAMFLLETLEATSSVLNESPATRSHLGLDLQDRNGSSPLHLACSSNNCRVATALLERGANPNLVDNNGRSAVFFAMAHGYLDIFTQLLNYKAKVYKENTNVASALVAANEVNITAPVCEHSSPLDEAARVGQYQIIKEMLQSMPPGDADQTSIYSALVSACRNGQTEVAQLLSGYYQTWDCSLFALHAAAMGWGKTACIFGDRFSNINIRDYRSQHTALHYAVIKDLPGLARTLLSRGAQMDLPNASRCTPLGLAVFHDSHILTKMLIDAGANVNAAQDGSTALFEAIDWGYMRALRLLLLSNRISLDGPKNYFGQDFKTVFDFILLKKGSAIFFEVTSLPIEIRISETALYEFFSRSKDSDDDLMRIKALAWRGLKINMNIGPLGGLLHYAAGWGRLKLVNTLLDLPDGMQPDVNQMNSQGETPLQLATNLRKGESLEVIHLLLQKGARRQSS